MSIELTHSLKRGRTERTLYPRTFSMKPQNDTDFTFDNFGFAGFANEVTWDNLDGDLVIKTIAQNLARFSSLTAGHTDRPTIINITAHKEGTNFWPPKFAWTWLRLASVTAERVEFSIDPDGIGPSTIGLLQGANCSIDSYFVLVLIHTMTAIRQHLFMQGPLTHRLTAEEAEQYVDREDSIEFEAYLTAIQFSAADLDTDQTVDALVFLYGLDRRLALNPNLIFDPYALAQLILREPNTLISV